MNLATRTALAQQLLGQREEVRRQSRALIASGAESENERLLRYLASAVQAGDSSILSDYARWMAELLSVRQRDRRRLISSLNLLERTVQIGPQTRGELQEILGAARGAVNLEAERPEEEAEEEERTSLQMSYFSAAIAGDRQGAWEVMEQALDAGVSIDRLYHEVIVWTQRRLGELWARQEISEAREHLASAVTQSVLAGLYSHIRGPRDRGKILMVSVECETHLLPANIAADLLELQGWDVALLGSHIPTGSLLEIIDDEQPDVVGLAGTISAYIPEATGMILSIQDRFPDLPIVVGGQGLVAAREHFEELGVTVSDDPELSVFEQFGSDRGRRQRA